MFGRLAWFLAGVGFAAAAAARLFLRKPREPLAPPPPPEPVHVPEPAPVAQAPEPAAVAEPATPAPPPEPVAPAEEAEDDTRADDLRRRIEESKLLVEERDEFEGGETPVDEADPESRRRDVHDRAREMVERMRREEPES
jgi:hypothetical protein